MPAALSNSTACCVLKKLLTDCENAAKDEIELTISVRYKQTIIIIEVSMRTYIQIVLLQQS
jgi:hypothetical protein